MIDVSDHVIEFGDLTINLVGGQICRNGQDIKFSKIEFAIFMRLLTNYPSAVGRQDLVSLLSTQKIKSHRTVDVHIHRMRSKLLKNQSNVTIRTVHKKGYYLTVKDKENHNE